MPNVFATNKTSSSITVAGHKVYYIDSTDAEIVEVEKTSGQALPSVGDTVTFGNYPQTTSTPEAIEWTVLAVDNVNGKALLIAKKVLDCQKYNSSSASVTWETCSLRTWLNSTFFNAAFDSTEQGRIPLSHIETAGGNATDDNVFCMSDQEVTNTAYFADADARKALGTQKAIDAGVFTNENGYSVWWLRTAGSSFYFANYVYYDGGVQEYGVNATGFGVRPVLWLNFASSVKYNAFKYTLSGTPYWYVIDGEHDTWTDDLSAWGYSEVQPVETLPTVTTEGDFSSYNWLRVSSAESVSGGGNTSSLTTDGTDYPNYNTGDSYAILQWQQSGGTTSGRVEFSIVNANGKIQAHNNTSGALTFYQARVAVCSSNQATVVPVYNSSNVAYNAFKFTANNTDYYYVLDGTQTDWTDDLSSIGYHLPVPLPTVTLANAYAYSESDSSTMTISAGSNFIAKDASGNSITYNSSLLYKAYASYSGISDPIWFNNGWTPIESSGLLAMMNNADSGTRTVHHVCYATCSDSTATVVTVYNSSSNAYNAFKFTASGTDYYYVLDGTQTDWTDDLAGIGYHFTVSYLAVNKSRMTVGIGESYSLYNESGVRLEYDSTKTYTSVKYYTSSGDLVGVSALGITIGYVSGWSYLMLTNNTGAEIEIQRVEYTVS